MEAAPFSQPGASASLASQSCFDHRPESRFSGRLFLNGHDFWNKLAMTAADILKAFDSRQHHHFGHGTGSIMRLRLVSVLTVVGLHVAAGYALLQVEAVRQVMQEAAPLFVEFIGPAVAASAPPVVAPKVVVLPKQKASLPLSVTPIPDETPSVFEVTPAPPDPAPVSPALGVPAVAAITAPPDPKTPPPTPQPKLVSGVEYLRPPQPEYPTLSRRMNEEGRVIVRVLINPQGRPEQALVHLSSRSARLDQAAINAALAALFKPHTENGMALHVYALIPITFELTQ